MAPITSQPTILHFIDSNHLSSWTNHPQAVQHRQNLKLVSNSDPFGSLAMYTKMTPRVYQKNGETLQAWSALKSVPGMCQAWIRCVEVPGAGLRGKKSKRFQRGAERVKRRGFCGGRKAGGRVITGTKSTAGPEMEMVVEVKDLESRLNINSDTWEEILKMEYDEQLGYDDAWDEDDWVSVDEMENTRDIAVKAMNSDSNEVEDESLLLFS